MRKTRTPARIRYTRAMTGTKIASAVMEAAPTVSPVATTGLANPPVVRVAFTRAARRASAPTRRHHLLPPSPPPPPTVATTHVASGGRSVTTAALARMPAPTAVGVQQPLPLDLARFARIDIAEVNHEAAGPRIRMHFEPRGERYEVRFHGIGTIREQRVDKGHRDGRVDRLRKRVPHRRPQQRSLAICASAPATSLARSSRSRSSARYRQLVMSMK